MESIGHYERVSKACFGVRAELRPSNAFVLSLNETDEVNYANELKPHRGRAAGLRGIKISRRVDVGGDGV